MTELQSAIDKADITAIKSILDTVSRSDAKSKARIMEKLSAALKVSGISVPSISKPKTESSGEDDE